MTQGIYILHYNKPTGYRAFSAYGNPLHYVGLAKNIEHRIEMHTTGNGSEMTKVAYMNGCTFKTTIVEVAPSTENEAIVRKYLREYCNHCRPLPRK